jgi:hypothetical protein
LDITFPCLRFNIDSKIFCFISKLLNRSCRVQNLVSNKTGFAIFGISYNFLLNLQAKNTTHIKSQAPIYFYSKYSTNYLFSQHGHKTKVIEFEMKIQIQLVSHFFEFSMIF